VAGRGGSFRFLFLADTQLGCYATFSGFSEDQVERYAEMGMKVEAVPAVTGFEWDANRYREAVEIINATRPELVMIGGDLVDDANVQDQIDEFFSITAKIDDEIAVRWVPGNHDIADDFRAPTAASIRDYRDVFGPDHYSFRLQDTLFIALNTPVIDHPEHVPDEWENQLGFLTDELANASRAELDHIILVGHHPLFVAEPDEPDTYWNLPLERRSVILDLLHDADVKIGFAGHWHRNAIATDGPFTQITSGPVGYPLGDDPSGYRVVDVTAAEVRHEYLALDKN
jgi:3',5'-cyclic AMP phosphodiesterase CpdA